MKKRILIPALLALGWLSHAWAEAEFDMDLMQTIEDLSKNLVSNLALADAGAAHSDIAELDGLLAQVEAHYVQKGDAQDAADLARQGRTLLLDIDKLVQAGDFDAANAKNSEFSRTCKTCHKAYKKS